MPTYAHIEASPHKSRTYIGYTPCGLYYITKVAYFWRATRSMDHSGTGPLQLGPTRTLLEMDKLLDNMHNTLGY